MSFKIGSLDFQETNSYRERSAEIPIGNYFLSRFQDAIEVGNALHSKTKHTIIDKFDKSNECLNIDALDYDYTGKNVLSISTIEHMGIKQYGETQISKDHGIKFLQKIIKEAKNYLITYPPGFNKDFDKQIASIKENLKFVILHKQKNWQQDLTKNLNKSYPGNIAICIITNIEEFLK